MNAPLGRLSAVAQLPETNARERRREPRHTTCFEARVESTRGSTMDVVLADVSLHGCCVRGESEWLRQGAFVSIGLGNSPTLAAIVRWVRGDAAGMEFLRPVPNECHEWHDLMDYGIEG